MRDGCSDVVVMTVKCSSRTVLQAMINVPCSQCEVKFVLTKVYSLQARSRDEAPMGLGGCEAFTKNITTHLRILSISIEYVSVDAPFAHTVSYVA